MMKAAMHRTIGLLLKRIMRLERSNNIVASIASNWLTWQNKVERVSMLRKDYQYEMRHV